MLKFGMRDKEVPLRHVKSLTRQSRYHRLRGWPQSRAKTKTGSPWEQGTQAMMVQSSLILAKRKE
jgi:hypothetical protein